MEAIPRQRHLILSIPPFHLIEMPSGILESVRVQLWTSKSKLTCFILTIAGILRTVESSAQGRETGMLDALQDLEALMVKAKDMVRLAAELNEKLTAASTTSTQPLSFASSPASSSTTLVSSSEPEEATFIRSSLSQLGLQMSNAPVTLDMMKDERRWIEELARELAQILQGSPSSREGAGMMKDRGMIALDEVWGGWNRARGVGKPQISPACSTRPP